MKKLSLEDENSFVAALSMGEFPHICLAVGGLYGAAKRTNTTRNSHVSRKENTNRYYN